MAALPVKVDSSDKGGSGGGSGLNPKAAAYVPTFNVVVKPTIYKSAQYRGDVPSYFEDIKGKLLGFNWTYESGLVAGRANKQIAFELGISPRTVEIYRANLMDRMQAGCLSDLVRMALIVGISQGAYAFAPALFGLVREFAPPTVAPAGAAPWVFAMAALIQGLAIAAFVYGRKR